MPGPQGEYAAVASPVKKSKLSLKFLQKKEAKRALDFSEPQADEPKTVEHVEPEASSCDQVVPGPSTCPASPGLLLSSDKRETLVPFVGLNNLGNTCYLNSILQVGHPQRQNGCISYVIQLERIMQLNPMYEGYLQHDAQEVLQCILGYIQEACDTIRKSLKTEDSEESEVKPEHAVDSAASSTVTEEEDGQVSGKRKSDTEVGNAKKKPKSLKAKKSDAGDNKPLTRSKRKSLNEITVDNKDGEEEEEEGTKILNKEEGSDGEGRGDKASKEAEGKRKKKSKLSWLRPSGKQPSIFSKFLSVGKISSVKNQSKAEPENTVSTERSSEERAGHTAEDKKTAEPQEGLDLMEQLFQGCLVLRTRCLECESFTERREDFQDISVPVLDEEPSSPDDLSEVSPDPKPELKTLKWAIGQFASVERIVGEDKYFCETCHHYTEAERSLLFDKTPEVITIHLKRFSANGCDLDPYAGLSKVNTPLQTPLTLSLEEWCTRPSSTKGLRYQLFAVVMHSGITISSGHYTAYCRMSELKDVKLWEQREREEEETTRVKEEGPEFDDGEVSFSLNARGQRGASLAKTVGKKLLEGGVGLLGGQRSLTSCDIGSSGKQSEKSSSSGATEGSKRRKPVTGQNSEAGEETSCGGAGATEALHNLLDYEGKWLLFDDSEVRLFEEQDFLQACSPETSSSSTPYLLFYRRMPEP
ncbi:ubiquitin carboxyl-terminal hydrolase 1 [Notothenia coriiceps]|uniref:Ubiquitin carboxyl-terminal hydrolase n=1 Tax=Notothenia coriiceps TaxID=8208 RepID=A0A6I9PKZ5_9TELE|nr:PREDICTED: ubiquitin carboxyl-terminal hydrolase 1 [Notothenia coriiceps]